jgi:excisionase family DNA binding protein
VTGHPDDLLTVQEVTARLRISRATFYRWRHRGTGPATITLPGGTVRIRQAALDRWLAGRDDDHEENTTP